jgi:hypothetical protein
MERMAMYRQQVIWTALPDGIAESDAESHIRLSLYLAPRFEADGPATLDDFPDFSIWPQQLLDDNVRFTLEIAGRAPRPIEPTTLDLLDPVRWRALFRPGVNVVGFAFDDHTEHPLVSYSVGRVQRYLKNRYQEVAVTAPFGLPTTTRLAETFSSLVGLGDRGTVWRSELDRRHQDNGAGALDAAADAAAAARAQVQQDFRDLEAFHYRPSLVDPPPIPSAEQQAEQFDFHGTISALGDYPRLLRRLGLVLDFELPATDLGDLSQLGDGVRIVPHWETTATAERLDISPWTRTELRRFRPRSREDNVALEAGFIDPGVGGAGGLELVQVDVDGAAIKAVGMAATLGHTPPPQSPESSEPARAGTPTLRTVGFSIVRPENARTVSALFATGSHLNKTLVDNASDLELFAEDLVRGFRVDVWESRTGTWRSLHERIGLYRFPDAVSGYETWTESPDAEGFTSLGATERVDTVADPPPDPEKPLYVHEAIARWNGWSLSAPRPGKVLPNPEPAELDADGKPLPGEQTIEVTNRRAGEVGLETEFWVVPGSLPRLRFGNDHKFRMRTVDLAGNGLTLTEADAALALAQDKHRAVMPASDSSDGVFQRFDPVVAPVVVPRQQLRRGDSLDEIVLRSNFNRDPATYIDAHPEYIWSAERHIVPPKSSQSMAELHGLLDPSFGDSEAARALVGLTYLISSRDKGTLRDKAVLDIATGAMVDIGLVEVPDLTSTTHPRGTTMVQAVETFTLSPEQGAADYAVHHEAQLLVPYLPDPLARGAAVRILPGTQSGALGQVDGQGAIEHRLIPMPEDLRARLGTLTKVPFHTGSWPDLQPFRLRLIEGQTAGEQTWFADGRVLCVALPKGERVTLQLSCYISPDDFDLLGVWRWIEERLANGIQPDDPPDVAASLQQLAVEPDAVRTLAAAGAIWLLTPPQPITLIHAVQQPVEEPKLVTFEPFAEGGGARPPGATFVELAGQVRVHAGSTGQLDIEASWMETIDRPEAPAPATVQGKAHVYETTIALPGPDATPSLLELPATDAAALRHDFGDTKFRRVHYLPVGATRFKEYFGGVVTDPAELARSGPEVVIEVPSSARPPAPRIKYVVPAFEWVSTTDKENIQRRERRGGGVRVYLDRPWYASGNEEVLGVLLWEGPPPETLLNPDATVATPSPGAAPDAEQGSAEIDTTYEDLVRQHTTRWGRDPVWRTHPTLPAPGVDRFREATIRATGLYLPELVVGGELLGPVGVAGHPVVFDESRKLWSCDIGIDAGASYYPFVRLALARYQPHSIPGAHLSPVVLADFVQLAPDRSVTVITDPDNPDILDLAMMGAVTGAARGVDGISGNPEAATTGPGKVTGATSAQLAALPRIEVAVEKRIPGTTDDLGWLPVTLPVPIEAYGLTEQDGAVPELLWSGRVTLPPGHIPGQYRVVLREYDWLAADNPKWQGPADPTSGSAADAHDNLPFRPFKRLVFADAIEV